jgi:TRAP-type mannitol/chloroaromatic compound transport system substrate-binding protein
MGGWFKKEINSLKDFKGLKMRIPGLGGRVIAKAGGKPMLVPGGEIYTNLSTGVIDATEWVGPYHDYVMGFYKAASHYYYPGWHEPGPVLELMINRQEWNKLPAELQAVVRSCATALDQQMYAEWLVKDAEYLEKIRNETKVKVLPYPDDVLKAFKQYAQEAQQELVAKDKLGQKVLASFTQFQRTYQAHQAVTSRAYNKAQNL